MTYEEIVAKAKEEFGSADVSGYEGHLALQINITGEGEGAFYAEISDGKLFIEPYDYKDNDAVLTADGNDIINIFNGTLDPVQAFTEGKLTVTGDLEKALSIQPIIENNKKPAKKTTRKRAVAKSDEKKSAAKTTAKASAAKKTTTKKAEDKAETVETVKTTAKKTAAKSTAKTAAKK